MERLRWMQSLANSRNTPRMASALCFLKSAMVRKSGESLLKRKKRSIVLQSEAARFSIAAEAVEKRLEN